VARLAADKQNYKIKLASGRILGPMALERVRLLMLKGQILGNESAREYPKGEWKEFHLVSGLGNLLVSRAEGKLESTDPNQTNDLLAGATQILTLSSQILEPLPEIATAALPEIAPELPEPPEPEPKVELHPHPDADKTIVRPSPEQLRELEDRTVVGSLEETKEESQGASFLDAEAALGSRVFKPVDRNISQEKTVMFSKSSNPASDVIRRAPPKWRRYYRQVLFAVVVLVVGLETLLDDQPENTAATIKIQYVRPKLPAALPGASPDPAKSSEAYSRAMGSYVLDTVEGYKTSATLLHQALSYNMGNVKALAMLASCYLNLIDSSNKDESYFDVISELIKLSRAKSVDLPETVIADVEFYITVNKPEAAQDRIVKYTSEHQNYGIEMFYYLALAFFQRGDTGQAARYLALFPDQKAFSAKIFYLRGEIARKLSDTDSAYREYMKAVAFNPAHAKSRLRIAELLNGKSELKHAGTHLEYLVNHPNLLGPKDLAQAFYLHSLLSEAYNRIDVAIGDIEKAVKLAPNNHDYSLQLYVLRAAAGGSIKAVQKEARMYYFLGEGERLLKAGKTQEALSKFLEARSANEKSPVPLVKIGDMFKTLYDYGNARINYKMAADRSKENIEIWSKYIDILIQCFEWEEALKAMDRFRKKPGHQSSIDKAAADIYAKQGKFPESLIYYRKAMARDSIDPDVYIAYANTLVATKNVDLIKHAPFFYALALRFDPLNFNAIIGTAKAIAASESIDRAIVMLQDELQKGTAKAELISAIAELQIQKGDWAKAQDNVDQAMMINPEYAMPWKLQAQIYSSREYSDKHAMDKALEAYKSYSDRNPSDPSGYLERYRIYANQLKFDKANDELMKIYTVYPKYPNIHYFKGLLFSRMGNAARAAEEFRAELANNPNSVAALIAYGKELIEGGKYNEALLQFNKAMLLAPAAAEPKHLSAYANYLLKNYHGAVALYNAALSIDSANPLVYKRLGHAHKDLGDMAGAAAAFKKYLEMEPDAPDRDLYQRYR